MSIPYEVKQKLVVSGRFAEYYEYEKSYWVGWPRVVRFVPEALKARRSVLACEQERIRDDNVHRTRVKIRRLVNSNPDMLSFLTLTFAENVIDLKEANYAFNQFVKRLNRVFPGFKYLAVPEFQKRGAVHYHVICNFSVPSGVDRKEFERDFANRYWQNGFIKLKDIKNVDNVGAYICKYLGKANFDARYFKKRKFFYSFNLFRAVVVDKITDVLVKLKQLWGFFFEEIYSTSIDSKYLGEIKYKQFREIPIIDDPAYGF